MNKKTKGIWNEQVIVGVITITLFGTLHLRNIPTGHTVAYLWTFAAMYGVLTLLSVWLAIKLKGWFRVLAILNAVLAALVLGYDILGLALTSYL